MHTKSQLEALKGDLPVCDNNITLNLKDIAFYYVDWNNLVWVRV
jgi:hypothetical protein